MGVNRVHLIGKLDRLFDARQTAKSKIGNGVVVVEGQRNKDYVPVVFWGEAYDKAASLKGQEVEVIARVGQRSWEKDGKKVYVTEVTAISIDAAHAGAVVETRSRPEAPPPPPEDDLPF